LSRAEFTHNAAVNETVRTAPIANFQLRRPTAGRRRRHWRSGIGSKCRSDLTEQPETAAPGEPVPRGPVGSSSGSGSIDVLAGPVQSTAGTPADRQSGRRTAGF
jgi:hypothetical protein